MTQSDLNAIEQKLEINLPDFYTKTMLNYPFENDSFASEFTLSDDPASIIDCTSILPNGQFAVGHDGGEFVYYVELNGNERVFIHDHEESEVHNTVLAENWNDFLDFIRKEEEEIRRDEIQMKERKANKKWWQFWI